MTPIATLSKEQLPTDVHKYDYAYLLTKIIRGIIKIRSDMTRITKNRINSIPICKVILSPLVINTKNNWT